MELMEGMKAMGLVLSTGGALGAVLAWIYKKIISEPSDRAHEKIQMEYMRVMTETITPLTYEIKKLNDTLNDSKKDREKIHEELDEHGKLLSEHELRITVLENTGGKPNERTT